MRDKLCNDIFEVLNSKNLRNFLNYFSFDQNKIRSGPHFPDYQAI